MGLENNFLIGRKTTPHGVINKMESIPLSDNSNKPGTKIEVQEPSSEIMKKEEEKQMAAA